MKKTLLVILISFVVLPTISLAQDSSSGTDSDTASKISLADGTFLGNVKNFAIEMLQKLDVYRTSQKVKIAESLEKAEARRSLDKEAKPTVKALDALHLYLLTVLLFIFSVKIVFLIAFFLLAVIVIRRVFGFIFSLFRRREV